MFVVPEDKRMLSHINLSRASATLIIHYGVDCNINEPAEVAEVDISYFVQSQTNYIVLLPFRSRHD